jgi:hypothetical protein
MVRYERKKHIFLGILKATEKRAESVSGSGIQWYGSADLDPFQNITDPEHWSVPGSTHCLETYIARVGTQTEKIR